MRPRGCATARTSAAVNGSGCIFPRDSGMSFAGVESGTHAELCYAVHAEQNAIIQAAKVGVSTEGATIYITLQPCVICAKMLVNAGITRIVHRGEYPDPLSQSILAEAGIEVMAMD